MAELRRLRGQLNDHPLLQRAMDELISLREGRRSKAAPEAEANPEGVRPADLSGVAELQAKLEASRETLEREAHNAIRLRHGRLFAALEAARKAVGYGEARAIIRVALEQDKEGAADAGPSS